MSGGSSLPSARVLGRVDNWWFSKVAPALALSYCSVLLFQVATWPAARSILLIAFVGLCAGSYGHIINDVFDIEVDRNAGKRNHMAAFAPWQRFALCALTLALGFLPALFVHYSRTSLLLLAIEFLLPTIYSVPPLRLKGRGALGLVCDSLGAHMVPCLYVISVLAQQASDSVLVHTRRTAAFVLFTAIWALFLGLNGILIHEFEDRDNDIRSGIRTFATGTAFPRVRGAMSVFFAIELCAFAGIMAMLFPFARIVLAAVLLFVAGVAIKLASHWPHYRHYERDSTAIQWWQLSHPFYEAYLPVAAAIQCAWLHPALAVFPVLQFAVFASTFRQQATELEDVLRQSAAWIAWGGRLDADPNARAWPFAIPRLVARIRVRRGGSDLWSVRMARPGIALQAGHEYQVRFKVRADRTRRILFGVWQDHEPWQALGLGEELQVSPAWQTIWRNFVATNDDTRSYLGLWVGGDTGSVDIWRYSIRPLNPRKDSLK